MHTRDCTCKESVVNSKNEQFRMRLQLSMARQERDLPENVYIRRPNVQLGQEMALLERINIISTDGMQEKGKRCE